MSHYDGPPIDHGILSPSGRLSKRTKAHVIAKHQAEVDKWWNKKYPPPTAEEQAESERLAKIESLTHHAEWLELLASEGYRTRYHNKHAAKARAEIAELQV